MDKNQNSFDDVAKVVKRADAPEEQNIPGSFKESVSMFFKRHFSKKAWKQFLRNNFPHKNDSGKEIFRKVVMDISFVLLILALIYIVFYYFSYRGRINQNQELGDQRIDISNMSEYEQKQYWETIKGKYPDIDFPEGMSLAYAPHYAINQDVGGWLTIPNTNIDVILMQSKQQDYYLYKSFYKEYSRYGNPYFDSRCDISKNGLSKNTIIYGHNTHDGLMFHQLTNYMTLEGYKKAPSVILDTLYERTYWKIFAVMLTNSTPDADNGNLFRYLFTDFSSDAEFMNVIDGIMLRSMIRTGIDVKPNDKILTLYTCYQNIFENGRLVVFARQVRDGEDPEVDTSNAYFNSAARFPQAYYEKMGLTNPYINPEDLTTKPADETTSVPAKPTVPSTAKPTVPGTTKPAVPGTTKPAAPSTTKPAAPATTKPAVPGTTKPAVPSTAKPAAPATTKPAAPSTTKPAAPSATKPAA